jgi:cytochrome P450
LQGPSHNELKELEYLPMVIEETLRFFPPVGVDCSVGWTCFATPRSVLTAVSRGVLLLHAQVPLLGRQTDRDTMHAGRPIPKGASPDHDSLKKLQDPIALLRFDRGAGYHG